MGVIDFTQAKTNLLENLTKKGTIVLATSLMDEVSARSISYIIIGEKLYFQTDKTFKKYSQIINNPNVALCLNNIQLTGKATVVGHPYAESNAQFKQLFELKHKNSFDNYSHLENEIVIEVELTQATTWLYIDGVPYREFIDFSKNQANIEQYQ